MKSWDRMKIIKLAFVCFVALLFVVGAARIGYLALKVRTSKEFFAATTASCPEKVLQWYSINGRDPGEIRNGLWLNAGVKQKGFSVDLSEAGKRFSTYSKVRDLTIGHLFSVEESPECFMSISMHHAEKEFHSYISVKYQYRDFAYQISGSPDDFKRMLLRDSWLGVKEEDFDRLLESDGHVVLIEDLDFNVPVIQQRNGDDH